MLRNNFIKKNIHTPDIKHVIGHNSSIYIGLVFKTILFLFVLYVIYLTINQYIEFTYLSAIFAIIGTILFIKFIIDFLNLYLDGIALAPEGITLFLREGLLSYKTEFFERDKIIAINHLQQGLWDKVFQKGDLLINLEQGVEFPFENISSPKKQVDKILQLKERYGKNEIENLPNNEYQLIAEALGEVVKDYMEKRKGEVEEDFDQENYEY